MKSCKLCLVLMILLGLSVFLCYPVFAGEVAITNSYLATDTGLTPLQLPPIDQSQLQGWVGINSTDTSFPYIYGVGFESAFYKNNVKYKEAIWSNVSYVPFSYSCTGLNTANCSFASDNNYTTYAFNYTDNAYIYQNWSYVDGSAPINLSYVFNATGGSYNCIGTANLESSSYVCPFEIYCNNGTWKPLKKASSFADKNGSIEIPLSCQSNNIIQTKIVISSNGGGKYISYFDGMLVYNTTQYPFRARLTNISLLNISSSETTVGDNWTFSVRRIFNDTYSNWTNSTSQTIYRASIDNCSNSFGIPSNATALNVSFFNYLNASTNINYQSTTSYFNYTYSLYSSSLSKTSFCIYPNWLNIPTETQFLYTDSLGVQYSYFLNTNFSNNIQYLNLYTNNGTSQVLFSVLDLDGNALANYNIQILQYNVGTGVYTTTEILRTDTNGRAVGNIILNNAYYNILVYDSNNNLVKTLTGLRITTTTYTITVSGEADEYYTDLQNSLGVNTNVYFNNDTNNFVFTWSDSSGAMHMACLEVTNTTYLGTTTMYDSCVTSTAGTILYNIDPKNDTQYIATGYLKYDYEFAVGHAGFHLPDLTKLFNFDLQGGLFVGTLLILFGILIALPNAVLGIIYMSLALIVDVILGLLKFVDTSTAVGLGILSSIVLLGMVIIYIGGKQQ